MPALAPPKSSELGNELERYLSADIEDVRDAVAWWHAHQAVYPRLSRMALDYLTIPGKYHPPSPLQVILIYFVLATSVDVERLFSCGRLLLSHVRSRLTAQSTRALLCLGYWSRLNLVKTDDVVKVSLLPDIADEQELEDGWDRIEVI